MPVTTVLRPMAVPAASVATAGILTTRPRPAVTAAPVALVAQL